MQSITLLDNPNSVQQLKNLAFRKRTGSRIPWKERRSAKLHPVTRTGDIPAGIKTPPADCKILRQKIPGNGKRSLQGRTRTRHVPVLRSQPFRTLGGQADPAAEPSPEPHGRSCGSPRTGADPAADHMMDLLYDDIPDTLSQLIRTAFIARPGYKFIVSDYSAIEARVLSHLAGETWRTKVFAEGKDIYCASASQMFHVPVEKHGVNGHLRQKGKIAELALGYGGSVGALKSMGALDMGLTEEELQPLVNAWRTSNPNIVQFWWDVDTAVKNVIHTRTPAEVRGIQFFYKSGLLFIRLPSGRLLSYVKPRIGENRFGRESVTYEGTGTDKKWQRIESYGPKFVENIVQAVSRTSCASPCRTCPSASS